MGAISRQQRKGIKELINQRRSVQYVSTCYNVTDIPYLGYVIISKASPWPVGEEEIRSYVKKKQ